MKKLIFFLILVTMIPIVFASYTFNSISPLGDTDIYPPGRRVNFTWNVTTLDEVLNVSNSFNCSVLNSSDNLNYAVLVGPINTTNSSILNTTVLIEYGTTYFKINCSTMFSGTNQTHATSAARSFNISTKPNYDTLSPADGVTLDTVDVNFTWNFSVANVNIPTVLNCTVQGTYNSTAGAIKSNLAAGINISNSTIAHIVIARDDLRTTSWRMNCSNGSIDFFSSNFTFDIDINDSYDLVVPANDATISGVNVNFSWRHNVTNINLLPGKALNCSVHNASSVSGDKSELFKINATNGTAVHRVFAMAPQTAFTNVYWNINCTNGSIDFISSDYNFGMNINQEYTWQVPADNAILGDIVINFSWRPTIIDINLADVDSLNCTLQNTSNMSTGAPLHKLIDGINTTNNTITHTIITMGNRNPVAWRVNCSNGSIDFLSSVYNLGITYSLTTTNINPTEGETLTSRYVNYSWKFEALNVNLSHFNNASCDVWRNGTAIFTGINTTNATEINRTLSTTNGVYGMVTNCTNNVGEIFYNESAVRLFTVAEPVASSNAFLYELLAPAEVEILVSTSVNLSWIVNLTDGFLDTGEQIECSLNNRSGVTGGYSQAFKANITNATFYNRTITMATDVYHEWFVNCTTPYQVNPPVGLSDTRIFEIVADAVYYKYGIGFFDKFNITLNTGDTQIGGNLDVSGYLKVTGNLTIIGNITGDFSVDGNTLFVDATNNRVGIGTSNPERELHVVGRVNITGNTSIANNTFFVDATNNRVGIGTSNPTRPFEVYSGGGKIMEVYRDGAEEIWAGFDTIRDFNGNVMIDSDGNGIIIKGGGGSANVALTSFATTGWIDLRRNIRQTEGGNGGAVTFIDDVIMTGNVTINDTGYPQGFFFDGSTGKVGIGTATPNFKLDVNGKANVTAIITDEASGAITTCNVGEIRGNATASKICLCTTANNWKCATVS